MQHWIIVNVHWIPTFELPSSCHKRPGLLTYLFYCSCYCCCSLKPAELTVCFCYSTKCTFAFSALALALGIWPCMSLALAVVLTPLALITSLVMLLFTQRRGIAKSVGCFQRRLFVCLFVCQHANFWTSKHRMTIFGGRCIVQKSRPSSNLGS